VLTVVPVAVVVFEFDPYLRLDLAAVRWETLGIAGALLVALVAAAILARRTPAGAVGGPSLRLDDLLFIGLGAVPGAVIGGRIGYVLLHLDYYTTYPSAILDAAQGGLQLSLAVVGGTLTGLYVTRLLEAPAGRWLHAAAIPLLLGIEGGKLAMAWGGTGQGEPSTAAWSTAYLGPGPWGSLAPDLPSVPSQVVEGLGTAAVAVALALVVAAGAFGRRDGRLYLVAIGAWLVVRLLVATTWRDPAVVGPLVADQVISLVMLAVVALGLVTTGRILGSPAPVTTDPAATEPAATEPRGAETTSGADTI
jgi:phosphatidylglycerol:prolipoprotein diacylglycerol transferase